jgi:hypothetical protein
LRFLTVAQDDLSRVSVISIQSSVWVRT